MKTSYSVTASPYLTKPLRSLEQVKADLDEKRCRLEQEEIKRNSFTITTLKKNSH